MQIPHTLNADFIDSQFQKWKKSKTFVSADWQMFFAGFELGGSGAAAGAVEPLLQTKADMLIYRYRDLGHLLACMDPLSACPTSHPFLDPESVGIDSSDLEKEVIVRKGTVAESVPLKKLIQDLREIYCHSVGVEYMHLQDPTERKWLQDRMEPVRNRPDFGRREKRRILEKLIRAVLFEQTLNKKYVGVTRFSLEGGEVVIPLLDEIIRAASANGCREVIMGMAHRGRLNVQCNVLGKSYETIFSEFESCYDPEQVGGSGDVKYHNGYMARIASASGDPLTVYLVDNPSHLEAVDPVVEGIARARQDLSDNPSGRNVLPLLIHGDAAFAGQGIVAETLNMSQLAGYLTGGTVHLIINNQIGYTTLPEDARSTRYSTDVAKMLMVPVFHIHGEDPETACHIARLAVDYRRKFAKDVVIDIVCYRRYGHNEGDEPYFTQPQMYDRISERPPLNELYGKKLLEEKVVTPEEIRDHQATVLKELNDAYDEIHGSSCLFPMSDFFAGWDKITGRYTPKAVKTAVPKTKLVGFARELCRVPKTFTAHPKLERLLQARLDAVEKGAGLDWGNAESLAFASILDQEISIRLSGQDVQRGTFSHRHAVLNDRKTGNRYIPLEKMTRGTAMFMPYNSHLAEAAVIGFEYGYAITRADALTIWEAQFGDFANNAQAIIDLFIAGGETKWRRLSGLVLLLPHGWEGLGPEHSSARLERFLQLCAEDNLLVCNPTTPAQYFHLLRRQVAAPYRKPLVVMSPKSLLRHPAAVSRLSQLTAGAFQTVLEDPPKRKQPERLNFCSGKIYYQLIEQREKLKDTRTAVIRLEQLHPWPHEELAGLLKRYGRTAACRWVQEEPENMGAWQFVRHRLEDLAGRRIAYVGRPAAASPATGFPKAYRAEQAAVIEKAFAPS